MLVTWIVKCFLFVLSHYLFLYTVNAQSCPIQTFRKGKEWLEKGKHNFHAFIWNVLTLQTQCFMAQHNRMKKPMYYIFAVIYFVVFILELILWIFMFVFFIRWKVFLWILFAFWCLLAFVIFRFIRIIFMVGWTLLTWPIWCCLYWIDALCHKPIKEDMNGIDEFAENEQENHEDNVV